MKYMLINDLHRLFKKRKIWIIMFFIIVSFFSIFLSDGFKDANIELLLKSLGVKLDLKSYIYTTIYLFINTFYIFAAIDIFFSNVKIGVDNVFLRITRKKWYLIKIFFIFIIVMFLKLILYLIIGSLYAYNGIVLNNIVLIFLLDTVFTTIINIIIITIIQLFYYNRAISYIATAFVSIILGIMYYLNKLGSQFFLKDLMALILILLILIIIAVSLNKKILINTFERSF